MLPDRHIRFSISIVSHGHGRLIALLLKDLADARRHDVEVILTWNLADEDRYPVEAMGHSLPLITILNTTPHGFAENHNLAFQRSGGENFVILNPDIRLPSDPFDILLNILRVQPGVVCAPMIFNPDREPEDSARFFPTPWMLVKKAVAKACGAKLTLRSVPKKENLLSPDWIAGMFMVIPRDIYRDLGGLSERYFLYYEDVDFCARARLKGIEILVTSDTYAIHDARRESHRDLRFLSWHVKSAFKFFTSQAYLTLKLRSLLGKKQP
ncbi:hypothetical protein KTQ42_10735|uniref:hypothetical protein n=1 Tax=Noviherbaspirillum sp. L7-7A TaxID=2850560 RepID=UPI001C2CBE2D|nr:hypothetical protein [Noviherbaspirillum sp. L7-7A]MBV0879778.1 hypothetical protein [Noviherbaspirillum sp. L7-7A]